MATLLTILAVAAILWTVYSKAKTEQRHQDEIEVLETTVKGLDAALKLKREQERARDQEASNRDQETADRIRSTRDRAAAIGFVRDALRPTGPGPGEPEVPGSTAPSKAKPE